MATITNEFPAYPNEYRKKPIVIKALKMHETFEVNTLEGVMKGNTGDYLIQGVKGEFYPCKPDIFEASYEPAEEPKGLSEQEVKDLVDCIIEEMECVDCRTDSPFIDYQRGGLKNIIAKLSSFYDIKVREER